MPSFSERLQELGYESYSDYLQSPHWKHVKKRYKQSKMPKRCWVCRKGKVELHHRTYKNLGNERLNDLITLCRRHHEEAHRLTRAGKTNLWKSPNEVRKERRKAIKRGRPTRMARAAAAKAYQAEVIEVRCGECGTTYSGPRKHILKAIETHHKREHPKGDR